jgi:DivIVA domain-containing protein
MRDTRRAVVEREKPAEQRRESVREYRHYVPADIADVSFPNAVRGYDRQAVDEYVQRVNRAIAELKVSASPPAAVRNALEQAQAKVDALMRAAEEAADEIMTSAQKEAAETTQRAKAEAAELLVHTSAEADRVRGEATAVLAGAQADAKQIVASAITEAQETVARAQAEADERLQRLREELAAQREQAEARMRDIHADTEAVWNERHELLEDISKMAAGLVELAGAAAQRVAKEEPGLAVAEEPDTEAVAKEDE